jgi:hypothetical protein
MHLLDRAAVKKGRRENIYSAVGGSFGLSRENKTPVPHPFDFFLSKGWESTDPNLRTSFPGSTTPMGT